MPSMCASALARTTVARENLGADGKATATARLFAARRVYDGGATLTAVTRQMRTRTEPPWWREKYAGRLVCFASCHAPAVSVLSCRRRQPRDMPELDADADVANVWRWRVGTVALWFADDSCRVWNRVMQDLAVHAASPQREPNGPRLQPAAPPPMPGTPVTAGSSSSSTRLRPCTVVFRCCCCCLSCLRSSSPLSFSSLLATARPQKSQVNPFTSSSFGLRCGKLLRRPVRSETAATTGVLETHAATSSTLSNLARAVAR